MSDTPLLHLSNFMCLKASPTLYCKGGQSPPRLAHLAAIALLSTCVLCLRPRSSAAAAARWRASLSGPPHYGG